MKGAQTNDRRSPLPRRTGHEDFPHPALARVSYARKRSQRNQAEVLQVSVEGNTQTRPPATLTAPTQVFAQAMPHGMIEVAERLARVTQAEAIGPAAQVAIQPPNQFRQGCVALLRVNELAQHFPLPQPCFVRGLQVPVPLCPPILVAVVAEGVAQKVLALTGLPQFQHASLLPADVQPQIRPRQRLWLPVRGCPRKTPNRASQVPAGSFRARCLLSPQGVRSVPMVVASRSGNGFTSSARLASPSMCNAAAPSSRDATARAFASPSLSERGRPHSLWVRLHDSRPIIMVNSFQLTGTS